MPALPAQAADAPAASALSTVLPFQVAVTFSMNIAGTSFPLASLRWPVSIGCDIRIFTSATSPFMVARIRIGSAMVSLREVVSRDQPPQPPRVTFTTWSV